MKNVIVTREDWLDRRAELLHIEKAHTHERDRIASLRRELPWVLVDKQYQFEGPSGTLSLGDLFKQRSQLIIYHLMFGEGWSVPCVGCSAWADAMNGTTQQFSQADARLIAISRAPYKNIATTKSDRNWTFSWVSSASSDFNVDFGASLEDLNQTSSHLGTEELFFDRGENHGISVFYKDEDGQIFHTYSCYNRGIEAMNSAMGYLDILPKGRAS